MIPKRRFESAIDFQIQHHQHQIENLRKQKADKWKEGFLTCECCGKRTQVKSITLTKIYWYESPWGCTGGDQWHFGFYAWNCQKCDGHQNKLGDYKEMRIPENCFWEVQEIKERY